MTAQGGLMANFRKTRRKRLQFLQRYGFNFQKKYGQNFFD